MRFFENLYIRKHTNFCSSVCINTDFYRKNTLLYELEAGHGLPFRLPSLRNFYTFSKNTVENCFLIKPAETFSQDLTVIAVITDSPERMIAVYRGSVFAGYALYEVHSTHIYLDKCFVKEDFRSCGIASRMLASLKVVERELIQEGIPLFVYAYPFDRGNRLDQDKLNDFYRKHGFRLIPHMKFWN